VWTIPAGCHESRRDADKDFRNPLVKQSPALIAQKARKFARDGCCFPVPSAA